MSRAFGFLALMATGVLAVLMLAGALTGTAVEVSSIAAGAERAALSPLAIGYGVMGVMMGFAMARLMLFSWIELPRLALRWLKGQRRTFAMMGLACLFGGVLLFY